jgi:hypothetical protein
MEKNLIQLLSLLKEVSLVDLRRETVGKRWKNYGRIFLSSYKLNQRISMCY